MSISLQEAKDRAQQLKNDAERSAQMHNVLLGRLAESESLVAFLTHAAMEAAKAVPAKTPTKATRSRTPAPKAPAPVAKAKPRSRAKPKTAPVAEAAAA